MTNELHERIFQALEEYRKKHPEFIYITRTERFKDKLDAGLWLLGGDNYAWISWIKRSYNMNHSPALRLLLKKIGSGISCTLENSFKREVEPEIIKYYEKARGIISKDYKEIEKKSETNWILLLEDKDGIEALIRFLDNTKPKLDALVREMGLEEILYTKEVFDKRMQIIADAKKRIANKPVDHSSYKRYWLFAPGRDANMWDEFYNSGIMGLGWEGLGNLNQYTSKDEIEKKLQELKDVSSSKNINATANYDFLHTIKKGDIIIAKKGRSKYIGYGVVTSDYLYDDTRSKYKSIRHVDWKKKGVWADLVKGLPMKTLTDITKNQEYVVRLSRLIGFDEKENNINRLTISVASLNTILYGPPGTGKTYSTIDKALNIVDPDFLISSFNNRAALLTRFRDLYFDPSTEKGQIAFVTFHQSMSYEDFIEGIKPMAPESGANQLSYDIVPGIFKQLVNAASTEGGNFIEKIEWLKNKCSEADNQSPIEIKTSGSKFTISYRGGRTFRIKPKPSINPDSDYAASIDNIRKMYEGASRSEVYNPTYVSGVLSYLYDNGLVKDRNTGAGKSKPYVLIIDEINRGNVSQIFGELITLIEKDKRIGGDEAIEIILPYSKEKFGVPSNLYIIGTMNTADRSVEALDTALRRRFTFEEMPPRYDLPELAFSINDHPLPSILQTINARLEKLLDKDHMIGHSYFIFKDTGDLKSSFIESMYKNIIPLLQEYFFGDYGKIGLVLGRGFVRLKNSEKELFSDFEYSEIETLTEKPVYEIIDYRSPEGTLDMTFDEALDSLMTRRT